MAISSPCQQYRHVTSKHVFIVISLHSWNVCVFRCVDSHKLKMRKVLGLYENFELICFASFGKALRTSNSSPWSFCLMKLMFDWVDLIIIMELGSTMMLCVCMLMYNLVFFFYDYCYVEQYCMLSLYFPLSLYSVRFLRVFTFSRFVVYTMRREWKTIINSQVNES